MGRSSWAGAILLAVWAAAAATSIGWWLSGGAGWRLAAAAVLTPALGAVAAWSWWREPPGLLAWDGARWSLSTGTSPVACEGVLSVALDLQQLLLVRWSSDAGTRWFWLQRGGPQARWDALRRAVYSRPGADAPSGAEPPPSATP
ncbi:MAG: hypothetical protein ACXWJJ_07180 [Ramlibacter sp.]